MHEKRKNLLFRERIFKTETSTGNSRHYSGIKTNHNGYRTKKTVKKIELSFFLIVIIIIVVINVILMRTVPQHKKMKT